MGEKFKGNVIKIEGIHVNADSTMGWYLGMDSLPADQIADKFMSGIDPEIRKNVKKGDILVCGKDFGYGKVHGSLFTAMKMLGVSCIVAESFSTQMIQTGLMFGAFLVESPNIMENVDMGDEIEVDFKSAEVINLTKNRTIEGKKFPPFLLEVMECGGQMGHLAMKMAKQSQRQ